MNLTNEFLAHLERVKEERPGQYKARCPAHDDRNPSLSVATGDDGRVLLYCHAGCSYQEIVEALGMQPGDLFSDNGAETAHQGPAERRIVKTYDYVDGSGALLFQTVRYKPKGFRQRRPDGEGGWVWNLKGAPRVLYRLPEILAADPDQWIIVCEGEKSADAIRALGLVATTNPMGAGKWRHVDQKPLEGRNVAIIPDEDDQGQDHAAKVGAALRDVADQVRIVHLPSVTIKSDPADWLAAGGTKADLLELLEAAPNIHEDPLYWTEDYPPTTSDYVAALASIGYTFRLNVCDDRVEVNGEPISDVLRAKIRAQMRDLNYRRVNVLEDAWTAHAYDERYHPVRQFLNRLEWDGEDHIARLADFIEDENNYFHLFFRRWVVGAVARAFEERSCQNRMLILDGPQGMGKSYLVRWLASPLERPELYIEGPIIPDDKDSLIRLISAWLWEVSELGSTTRRSDRESLKYFLSMQQVTVRKPYGHYDLVKPALANFVGTVNNTAGFLDDPTGYRRFMSVHLVRIDWQYDDVLNPTQVWAQAKALYDAGERWELDSDEADLARHANEAYEIEDPLQDVLMRCYEVTQNPRDFVASVDIRETLNGNGWRLQSPRAEAMAVSDLFKRMGIDKGKYNGERGYFGIRKTEIPL